MSIDWKRVLKGAAGVTVAAALCVAAAMPANGADGDTSTGTDAVDAPVVADGVDCANVTAWDALSTCLQADASGSVTITSPINVQGNAPITVNGEKTLDSTVDANSGTGALTSGQNGDAILNVFPSASLTLTDKFSFKQSKRFLVYVQGNGKLTVDGGTYADNDTTGSAKHDMGTLVYNAGGTVMVKGGTFTGNKAANGGVIHQASGSTTITGGMFENNTATMNGGAIISNGKLTVWGGNVTFDGNRAKADPLSLRSFSSGGGAIWATGELHVKNDSEGKPKFINNQALVQEPTDGKLGKGGAGGAIFFNTGEAYIIGGDYQNNKSGYLGGAIYTEEGSTTYVGKAVAFENTAGHFGGGLWFCPSGNSAASKGGNIALFGNSTNPDIDGNPDNAKEKILPEDKAKGADTTQAGADLAIMNPYWKWANGWLWDKDHKNKVSSNQFLLLDTWFTDRSKAAVTWQWDNAPLHESSGYHDSWMPTADKKRQDIRAVLATTDTTTTTNKGQLDVSHIPTTGLLLQLQANPGVKDDATTWIRTGVGLKAKPVNDDAKNGAKTGARVYMTGNQARLSGGAFGSNGVVIFDTPYSMEWNKTAVTADGKPDTDKPLAGSTWTLTYTGETPYNDPDMRPADCPTDLFDTQGVPDDCWHKTNGTWSVDIIDNGKRDNNPLAGGLGVENLAPGTYELREKTPPAGYHATNNVYTFTIVPGEAGVLPPTPKLTLKTASKDDDDGFGPLDSTANAIGNKPIEGHLAWTKNADGQRLPNTTWTITHKANGTDVTVKVSDCVKTASEKCDADKDKTPDTDPAVGEFDIPITNAWPDGSYTLHEETAPAGYWKVVDRTFTIATVSQDRTVTWNDGKGGDMTDEVMGVAWSKIDATDHGLLAGSQWTITKPDDKNFKTLTVSDCETEGCTTPENETTDQDTVAGKFKVTGLTVGDYELKEAKAPAGYELSTTTYTFTIEEGQHTITDVRISKNEPNSNSVEGNAIPNSKTPVSALPFTGGRSGLDWLVIGGGLALAATTAGLVTGRARRREEF